MSVTHLASSADLRTTCCGRGVTAVVIDDGDSITANVTQVTCRGLPPQVREHHAPGDLHVRVVPPDVDLTTIRSPGGEPWASTDRLLARSASVGTRGGAPERRNVLEERVRDDERELCARRVDAWAATLSHVHEAQIAAAAAEVIRGRR